MLISPHHPRFDNPKNTLRQVQRRSSS